MVHRTLGAHWSPSRAIRRRRRRPTPPGQHRQAQEEQQSRQRHSLREPREGRQGRRFAAEQSRTEVAAAGRQRAPGRGSDHTLCVAMGRREHHQREGAPWPATQSHIAPTRRLVRTVTVQIDFELCDTIWSLVGSLSAIPQRLAPGLVAAQPSEPQAPGPSPCPSTIQSLVSAVLAAKSARSSKGGQS